MTTQTTLLSYTVVFSLVFTVLNIYLIRDGRLLIKYNYYCMGAYLKFCAKGWALIRAWVWKPRRLTVTFYFHLLIYFHTLTFYFYVLTFYFYVLTVYFYVLTFYFYVLTFIFLHFNFLFLHFNFFFYTSTFYFYTSTFYFYTSTFFLASIDHDALRGEHRWRTLLYYLRLKAELHQAKISNISVISQYLC